MGFFFLIFIQKQGQSREQSLNLYAKVFSSFQGHQGGLLECLAVGDTTVKEKEM